MSESVTFRVSASREFTGDAIQVLRLRTGEFVDQPQVRHRVGENGSDDLSDISRCNGRGLALLMARGGTR